MYGRTDFELDESSDAIPGKFVLTITDPDGEEFAVIVHRTYGEPFDADDAEVARKLRNADRIVDALNATN